MKSGRGTMECCVKPTLRVARLCCGLAALLAIGCTKPKQTTAIGSGVGGAVGAGLGAIVGNQTGNAGSGLAIGAVAGAATGALISNALQAQDEKITAQSEALKRQEKLLQAQKNELAELRTLNNDSGFSSGPTTPRYRYRPTSIDATSPEVERQIAALERRGPAPRHPGAGPYHETSYSAPKTSIPPAHVSAPATQPREPLARYDIRAEIAGEKPARQTSNKPAKLASAVPLTTETLPASKPKKATLPAQTSETTETETVARAIAPSSNSNECKEAMSEKELASQAPDNSDKLFHLRRALRLCPNSAVLHYELGSVYAAMERASNAEEEYQQALSIDPSFVAAKKSLAELLKNESKF